MTEQKTWAEMLEALPTISQGATDNLKVDTGDGMRVWLSRMTLEDGAQYENEVTVETFDGDRWVWVENMTCPGDWTKPLPWGDAPAAWDATVEAYQATRCDFENWGIRCELAAGHDGEHYATHPTFP